LRNDPKTQAAMPHLKAPFRSVTPVSNPDGFLRTDGVTADLTGYSLRGAVATIVSQALRFLISVSGMVVLARLLTPTDYGLIGMVAAVTGIVAIFKDLGLDAVTVQRAYITEGQISTLFWINAVVGLLLALATIGISPAVAWFYGESSLTAITATSALAFLLGGTVVQHEALLRRQMRFARLASVDVGSMLVGYATGIVLAWSGAGYWALVFSQLSQSLTRTLALWLFVEWRPRLSAGFSGIGSMLSFGGHLTGFAFVNYFARNLDNLLIGRYWGAYQLGLYSRAYQVLTLPIDQINSPITAVAVPALSRLTDSPDRYRRAYLRILEKIAMLTMPLMAFLIMTSDWIVDLLLGPQWSGVSTIFALLGIAGLVQPVASTAGWLFITQGRAEDMFRWGLVGGALTVTAILLGLPWGATGVAASYSLMTVVVLIPLLWWFIGRKGPVRALDFYRTIGPPTATVITIILALLVFRRSNAIQNEVLGVFAAACISGCLTLLVLSAFKSGRAAIRDIGLLLALLPRRRRGGQIDG
jgi:O-antigen/teichoic acid export membrane protein